MKTEEVQAFYDKKIRGEYKCKYEHERWFSTPMRKAQYEMTKDTLLYLLNLEEKQYSKVLEVGPGPGTWTKLLIEKNSHARFTLVDVSKEMLSLARDNLEGFSVQFIHSGFLESKLNDRYDFFFSSRAIEYIQDKKAYIEKISALTNPSASGIIITKNPKYGRVLFRRRKISALHRNQIKPKILQKLLREAGFEILCIVPVTLHFPFINNSHIDKILFSLFGKRSLTLISGFFAESYSIYFKKI